MIRMEGTRPSTYPESARRHANAVAWAELANPNDRRPRVGTDDPTHRVGATPRRRPWHKLRFFREVIRIAHLPLTPPGHTLRPNVAPRRTVLGPQRKAEHRAGLRSAAIRTAQHSWGTRPWTVPSRRRTYGCRTRLSACRSSGRFPSLCWGNPEELLRAGAGWAAVPEHPGQLVPDSSGGHSGSVFSVPARIALPPASSLPCPQSTSSRGYTFPTPATHRCLWK